jgi:hypothetical protein
MMIQGNTHQSQGKRDLENAGLPYSFCDRKKNRRSDFRHTSNSYRKGFGRGEIIENQKCLDATMSAK